MEVKHAYNSWAATYDQDINKTRDLEGKAMRETLGGFSFKKCLEIGCGTGKNTGWLAEKSVHLTAVDFSEEMIAKAKEKNQDNTVEFIHSDILQPWNFGTNQFDLVAFSLVLEHIQNLDHIFEEASNSLQSGGYLYVGELHPYKQYSGSKARFESTAGLQVIECYTHDISSFIDAALKQNLKLVTLAEYKDDENEDTIPRILAILFQK